MGHELEMTVTAAEVTTRSQISTYSLQQIGWYEFNSSITLTNVWEMAVGLHTFIIWIWHIKSYTQHNSHDSVHIKESDAFLSGGK